MKESERLRAAKALIDTPKKWTRGASARDKFGEPTMLVSEEACSWCTMGALSVVSDYADKFERDGFERARGYLKRVIPCRMVADYNDSHTHEEVMRMFDKAIEIAESEGN